MCSHAEKHRRKRAWFAAAARTGPELVVINVVQGRLMVEVLIADTEARKIRRRRAAMNCGHCGLLFDVFLLCFGLAESSILREHVVYLLLAIY